MKQQKKIQKKQRKFKMQKKIRYSFNIITRSTIKTQNIFSNCKLIRMIYQYFSSIYIFLKKKQLSQHNTQTCVVA